LARLTAGNFGEVLDEGQPKSMAAESIQALQKYTPVLSSLWMTRLAYERLVINQLQLAADPLARARFAQDARRRKSMFGQYDWWRKGEALPEAVGQ
jgi:hypothetical protein